MWVNYVGGKNDILRRKKHSEAKSMKGMFLNTTVSRLYTEFNQRSPSATKLSDLHYDSVSYHITQTNQNPLGGSPGIEPQSTLILGEQGIKQQALADQRGLYQRSP